MSTIIHFENKTKQFFTNHQQRLKKQKNEEIWEVENKIMKRKFKQKELV